MPLILPNTIVNGQNADAVPVEQNYSLIQSHINNEMINRDGSVAMTAPLLLSGDPTQANQAANKDYVDAVLPIGIMMPWPALDAPAGVGGTATWMLCAGQSLAISSYPDLHGVLGANYGTATAGNFLLPNLTGRILIGLDIAKTGIEVVGKKGGTFVVPVPQHLHAMPHTHPMPHTHEMPHLHSIDHNHASFLTTATAGVNGGQHTHELATSVRQTSTPGTTSSFMQAGAAGTTDSITNNPNIDENLSQHVHLIDVPLYDGNSGQPDDATTDASSAANTGAVSTANTANTGTSNVEHLMPYVVMNYIIRVI